MDQYQQLDTTYQQLNAAANQLNSIAYQQQMPAEEFKEVHPQWGSILLTELAFAFVMLLGLGFVKLPRFLRRKQLSRRFPWGYYPDQMPRNDRYYPEEDKDFLHNTGTEFGALDSLGDYGEFSGFGELGEYGSTFFGGDAAGE